VSRYWFIAAEKAHYPVSLLCRVLGGSRASFYAWADRSPSARARANQELIRYIRTIHRASRGSYGAPPVHAELRDDYGVRVARKRVARLMRAHGLVGCRRRRRRGLTRPGPGSHARPDLVGRLFDPGQPDRTWFADISYIPTQEGWLYLRGAGRLPPQGGRLGHGGAPARRAGLGRPADVLWAMPAGAGAHPSL
jgi:putative transposase